MRRRCGSDGGNSLAWVAALVALWAPAAGAAEPARPPSPRTPEDLRREIRRLEEALRELRGEMERLRDALPRSTSADVTVPPGARQSTAFNAPSPDFGPSEWVPSWPPVRNPSPQSRQRLPRELGVPAPPVDGPLDYPQFVPGSVVVEHGLGARSVQVSLALLNSDGSLNPQVDPNRVVVTVPTPPDGTFRIFNFNEQPVAVRWTAQLPAE